MSHPISFRMILASLALVIFGSSANAAVVSNIQTQAVTAGGTYEFDQFDPLLGTLTGVELEYVVRAISTDTKVATAFCYGPVEDRFCSSDFALAEAIAVAELSGLDVYAYDDDSDFKSCTTQAVEGSRCIVSAFAEAKISGTKVYSDFAAFIGTGTIGFNIFGEGNISGSLTLTYFYDEAVAAVPLPAGFPLLLAALGGLGLVGRRRRRADG